MSDLDDLIKQAHDRKDQAYEERRQKHEQETEEAVASARVALEQYARELMGEPLYTALDIEYQCVANSNFGKFTARGHEFTFRHTTRAGYPYLRVSTQDEERPVFEEVADADSLLLFIDRYAPQSSD